jgi:protein gp37
MSTEIEQATTHEAKVRAERIRVGIEDVKDLVVQAFLHRDWVALGYESWGSYCTGEFASSQMFQLPTQEKLETVRSLRNSGLSTRAIAAATGQSKGQIHRQLSGAPDHKENGAPDNPRVSGSNGQLGLDGKVYTRPSSPGPRPDFPSSPQPVSLYLSTHDGQTVRYRKPVGKPAFNQTDGEGISWASWSWNPVTGCLHGCDYCYARSIANRWTDAYPVGFTPLFHHERLDAPVYTVIPAAHRDDPAWRRVFVCSMADLYGRWVPDEWIAKVHESMLTSPQWEYLLLTKFPARYVGLELPSSSWVGTSVDEQKRVRIAENAFRQIEGVKVKWLSLEPLREPLEFADLSMFDWVVIGAQTETRQPDGVVPAVRPEWDWVKRLTDQALEAGCQVHHKPNLFNGQPGMRGLNQYPLTGDGTT